MPIKATPHKVPSTVKLCTSPSVFSYLLRFNSTYDSTSCKSDFNTVQCYKQTPHDIDIVAGTYEILSLGKKNLDIYLQPNSHPPTTGVPRIIWKLLYNTFTNDAVVFIAINNPHATKCELDLCPDRCLHNSPLADFKDPWTGCIICCSYKDARERIRGIPHYDHVALVILVQE